MAAFATEVTGPAIKRAEGKEAAQGLETASRVPKEVGTACPVVSERRGGARSISILRGSVIRMGSWVRANYLPRRFFGIVADHNRSNNRRAWLMRVPDFLGVCAAGDLLIPDSPLCASS